MVFLSLSRLIAASIRAWRFDDFFVSYLTNGFFGSSFPRFSEMPKIVLGIGSKDYLIEFG